MGSTIEAGTLGGRFGYLRFGDGLSAGGLIAQELALGDPDAVDRLALVVSGARIAERHAGRLQAELATFLAR